MTQYYEDLEAGGPRELGDVTVTRDDIVEFAEQYDPLPYHLDEEAAIEAGHDGLIASGYHTLSLVNGVVTREYRRDVATVAGFGIDDLQWPRPVTPGDTLTVFHEIVDKRLSESYPGAGITEVEISAENDAGETVISYETAGLVKQQP
jgi:acyl dehydratase